MIDVAVGLSRKPSPLPWIRREILLHVLVDFLLQVHTHSAVGTNDFVGANSGIARNISSRIGNAHIRRVITNLMVGSFDRGSPELTQEILPTGGNGRITLRQRAGISECQEGRQKTPRHESLHEQ